MDDWTMTTFRAQASAVSPKDGLTLGELGRFVQDAMRLDLPPETPIRIAVGWSGQIQRITTGKARP